MKIDDASWHCEAKDFPESLEPEAGATHIGMFFAWLVVNDLISDQIRSDLASEFDLLRKRLITPGQFVWRFLDGTLSDHDLSDKGKAFTESYYQPRGGAIGFLAEYERMYSVSGRSEYFAADDWQTYEQLAPLISSAYARWTAA